MPPILHSWAAAAWMAPFIAPNEEAEEVRFVCFDDENYEIYQELLEG